MIVYLFYTFMGKCLIVYFPCMSLKDMLDCAHTIYMSDMSLQDMDDCILIVYYYGEMFDCIFTVYELETHA